ncbi:MAG TPA: hypothetical protein VIM62_01900, partial [Acidobacteriaceae bacterium]
MAENFQPNRRWELQDWIAGAVLFITTAAFVLWQNAHIAVLWDLSYLLDTSWRIALGQAPYRDFPLVHPPGTFLIQAALMRFLGRSAWIPICYAAAVGGAATVLTWRILLRTLQRRVQGAWIVALVMATSLCFLGIYSVYPHPIYDCDCAFAVLVAIFLLQWLAQSIERGQPPKNGLAFAAGVSAVAPCFFKQNIGLPFLLLLMAGMAWILIPWLRRGAMATFGKVPHGPILSLLAGVAVALSCYGALIQITAGWSNFWHWTVQFAGQRRLPGLGLMLANYRQPQLLWTAAAFLLGRMLLKTHRRRWIRAAGALLILAPFLACLVVFWAAESLDDSADAVLALWPLVLLAAAAQALFSLRRALSLRGLLPFLALAAIHGALLSQQLWGSTYAIWPLLLILLAGLLEALPTAADLVAPGIGCAIGAILLVCGGFYAVGHDRLSYLNDLDGVAMHASLPALRGMSAPGPYLADFEELVRYAEREIPRGDGILLLPGEEPFFFATGRAPQFPVQIFDRTTDPYSPDELVTEAQRRGIRWVIVKTR